MKFAAAAWWLRWFSATISPWQPAQALGVMTVVIVAPSCSKAPGSAAVALWHSQQPTPSRACLLKRHCAAMPGVFCV